MKQWISENREWRSKEYQILILKRFCTNISAKPFNSMFAESLIQRYDDTAYNELSLIPGFLFFPKPVGKSYCSANKEPVIISIREIPFIFCAVCAVHFHYKSKIFAGKWKRVNPHWNSYP